MADSIEREIKLRFASAGEARAAVLDTGALPMRERRLQNDCLLDTADMMLRQQRSALRVRIESGRSLITFKGPVQPAAIKVRDEIETDVGDGPLLIKLLGHLGFHPWFRYQKYREEFSIGGCVVAVDDTPVGAFVEIEGDERGIATVAEKLGRGPGDYVLQSYHALYSDDCRRRGVAATHMLFT
jgi:adenylate cyclase class 2